MSAPILITGATGHIGFRVLIHALTAGHTVRAAVRSQSKANLILSHPLIQSLNPGSRLSFTIVPDLTLPNAYDDAAEGVSHIIHIASPLRISSADDEIPMNEQDAFFIQPAVRGTLNVLHAAKKASTVRRVVITSSLVALVPIAQLTGQESRPAYLGPVQPHDRIPFVPGPYENEFEAYAASKIAALQEAEAWVARQGSSIAFDVVYLHPAFVEGRNDLASNAREVLKGTNTLVLGQVLGKKFDHPVAGVTVHVEDVARVHVQALAQYVPGNTSYILSQAARWEDVRRIVKREFTDAVQKRILPNCGSAATHTIDVDASLTEDVFGFQHIGFAEQVRSVVGHYLELRVRRSAERRMRKSVAGVGSRVIYGEALTS